MNQFIDEIHGRWQASAPAKVLVLTPTAHGARWVERLLLDRGPLVGLRAADIESFLAEAAAAVAGMAMIRPELLDRVGKALLTRLALKAIAEDGSYRRIALELFVELDRAETVGGKLLDPEAGTRDQDLVEAFRSFRATMPETGPGQWYDGDSPRVVLGAAAEGAIPLLRDTATLLACGFEGSPDWQKTLLGGLGAETIPVEVEPATNPGSVLQIETAGPEVEIAVVARQLRADRRPTVLIAPASELGRWTARLVQRDVPVRSWIARPATSTAVARMTEALLRLHETDRPARLDLEQVLFGPALRPWADVLGEPDEEEQPELFLPTIRTAWTALRRGSGTWAEWMDRLDRARVVVRKQIEDRVDDPAALEARIAQSNKAFDAIRGALDALREAGSARELGALLAAWGLQRIAAVRDRRGPDLACAALVLKTLGEAADSPVSDLAAPIRAALATSAPGGWHDQLGDALEDSVWLIPYEAELPIARERAVLTALESFPVSPAPSPLLSEGFRRCLGLQTERERFEGQMHLVNRLASGGNVVLTWRASDGQGGACSPGPWLAARVRADRRVEGHSALSPTASQPLVSALERDVACPSGCEELARRVAAICSHEEEGIGPYTGALGIQVPPTRSYSVSGLQKYARLPYQYFLEKVLGLKEADEAEDELDAMEHGSLIHDALEQLVKARQASELAPVPAFDPTGELKRDANDRIQEAIREASAAVLADPVWIGDQNRWTTEFGKWWAALVGRMEEPVLADPTVAPEVEEVRAKRADKVASARSWFAYLEGDAAARAQIVEDKKLGSGGTTFSRAAKALAAGDDSLVAKATEAATKEIEAETTAVRKAEAKVRARQNSATAAQVLAAEYQFGSRQEPIHLALPGGDTLPITGVIDRIEWDPERNRLNVVDYKTGRLKDMSWWVKELGRGGHLQLPIYAQTLAQQIAEDDRFVRALGAPDSPAVDVVRLEFLKRMRPNGRTPGKAGALSLDISQVFGSHPDDGHALTVAAAACYFASGFAAAIERGLFPVTRRLEKFGQDRERIEEVLRVLPEGGPRCEGLPAPLGPPPDGDAAGEGVDR